MENLILNLNILMPLVLLVILGKILSKLKFVNKNFIDVSSKIVFRLTLPATLFLSASKIQFINEISTELSNLVIYGSIVMTLNFGIAAIISKFLGIEKKAKGAFIQGTCRSNFAVIGYPIILSIFGEEALLPSTIFTMFLIGITNSLSVLVLTIHDPENKGIDIKALVKNIVMHPLIDSIILGLIFSYFSIKLPLFVHNTLSYISSLTTPLALINIGAIFNFSFNIKKLKPIVVSVLFKSIIIPLIVVLIAVGIGFKGVILGIIFIGLVSPTPPSSFVMAKIMNSDEELAANLVVASTAAAAFAILIGISLMQNLSLI